MFTCICHLVLQDAIESIAMKSQQWTPMYIVHATVAHWHYSTDLSEQQTVLSAHRVHVCVLWNYTFCCVTIVQLYKNTSCVYALHSMINYVIMIHVTNGSGVHRVTMTLQDRLYPRQVSLLDSTVYCMFHVCCMCSVWNEICLCIQQCMYVPCVLHVLCLKWYLRILFVHVYTCYYTSEGGILEAYDSHAFCVSRLVCVYVFHINFLCDCWKTKCWNCHACRMQ